MGVGTCLGSVRSGVLRRSFRYRSANEALLVSKAYVACMRGLCTCSHPSHHQQGLPGTPWTCPLCVCSPRSFIHSANVSQKQASRQVPGGRGTD